MSKHIQSWLIPLMTLSLTLLSSLILLAACETRADIWSPLTSTAVNKPGLNSAVGDKVTPEKGTPGTVTQNSTIGFDCVNVNQITSTECETLVALYTSTDGPSWVDNSGWLAMVTPCTWSGIECAGGHISYISLGYNQLIGNLPPELGNLSHLRVLGLSSNRLYGSIPAELGNLVLLYSLYLLHNQLSGVIPTALGRLSQLSELDLSYNQLSGPVPEFIAQISGCSLWGNQLDGTITANGHVQ